MPAHDLFIRRRSSWSVLVLSVLLGSINVALAEDPAREADATPESTDQDFTASGETGAVLPEMVVEARNQVEQEIQKASFRLELDAAAVDSFLTAMDEEALAVSPVSGLQPHLNNLERLNSDQPPHCWLTELARTPVVTFYPEDPEGRRVNSWRLVITDFRGAPVKAFDGKGKPPSRLAWDGQSDRGEMLQVGYPYSYVFSITDKGTNTYNYAGVSFRLPAVDYRAEGDRVLAFAGEELFERERGKLTGPGKAWLTRAADEIRRHPYSPIRVEVVAEASALAEQRTAAVAAYLAESMIVPREQIETGAEQRPDLRAELDGAVTVIIEHAE